MTTSSLAHISTLSSYRLFGTKASKAQVAALAKPNRALARHLLESRECWLPLLNNPGLTAGAFELVTLSLAQTLLRDDTDLPASFPFGPLDKAEEKALSLAFVELAKSSRLVPSHKTFWRLFQEACLKRKPIRSDNYTRWLAFDIIIQAPNLPGHMLSALAGTTDPDNDHERGRRKRIAVHPSRSKAIYHKIAKKCTDPRTAEYMAWDPYIRTDPSLQSFFAKFAPASISIQGASLPEASDEVAKAWLTTHLEALSSSQDYHLKYVLVQSLQHLGARITTLLTPSHLKPLMLCPDKETRVATVALLALWPSQEVSLPDTATARIR